MASAARSLRLCYRSCRHHQPAIRDLAPRQFLASRALSTTPARRADDQSDKAADAASSFDKYVEDFEVMDKKKYGNFEQSLLEVMTPEERAVYDKSGLAGGKEADALNRMLNDAKSEMGEIRRPIMRKKNSFWHEEEPDLELISDELHEDDFEEDDITSMAHGKLDEIREHRQYARITAWEMPLLAQYAKPFEPPTKDMPLRFRYTSYLGEFHPAEKKVVVEFCPTDLGLTEEQQLKLVKLAGPRYNPEKEIVRMSCEMFEQQAQNKRYLGDLVGKLIAAAKDPKDTFADIPLDTRHHQFKNKPKFPKEWRMTEERKKELQAIRAQGFLADQKKEAEGGLIDGVQRIQEVLAAQIAAPALRFRDKVAELVAAPRTAAKGKPIRR
ncbi:uncharacterized protein E0L32_000175 [Thyridium curvatum]|uniref:Small ribosomal subunit protein mS35 mitochondrial conserved domain-containing protein n=1 Tax=Thyridium curvatum TaxID=1093900 RepID=A0A507BFT8_9PEZI|nr:uncharacterized protein E0L32_000175 [Thyridium curvatum]TPX15841.1 hypothetical protein E0L32_000175 [Thyridium curvatum]